MQVARVVAGKHSISCPVGIDRQLGDGILRFYYRAVVAGVAHIVEGDGTDVVGQDGQVLSTISAHDEVTVLSVLCVPSP